MVADSGYSTRENMEKMATREIDFLGTMRYQNVPRRANLPNQLPPSAFLYQREKNHYVCPEEKILHSAGRRKRGPGIIYHLFGARLEECQSWLVNHGVAQTTKSTVARWRNRRKSGGNGLSQEDG